MLEMRIRCNYMRACIYISSVEYVHKNILYIKQIKQKKRKRKGTLPTGTKGCGHVCSAGGPLVPVGNTNRD